MLDWFGQLLNKFADVIVSVLPHSPIQPFLAQFKDLPYLGYLNWFMPISSILTVCEVWLACIAIFYLYSIILRWVKAIGD